MSPLYQTQLALTDPVPQITHLHKFLLGSSAELSFREIYTSEMIQTLVLAINGEVGAVDAHRCGRSRCVVASSCCVGVEAPAIFALPQRGLGIVHCVGRRKGEKVGVTDRV